MLTHSATIETVKTPKQVTVIIDGRMMDIINRRDSGWLSVTDGIWYDDLDEMLADMADVWHDRHDEYDD